MNDERTLIGLYFVGGLIWTFYNSTSGYFHIQLENARKKKMMGWMFLGFILAVLLWPLGLGFCWLMQFLAWRAAGKGGSDGSESESGRS